MTTFGHREGCPVLVAKLKAALLGICEYTTKKKPTTLAEARHMLNLISVICAETLHECETEELAAS
jgi:hypothetical protein